MERARPSHAVRPMGAHAGEAPVRPAPLAADDDLLALIDGAPHFVALLATSGTVLEASEAGCRELGTHRDRLLGRPLWEALPRTSDPAIATELRARIRAAGAGRRTERLAVELAGPNGPRCFEVGLVPHRRGGGPVESLIAEAWDVTDYVRAARRPVRDLDAARREAAAATEREARAAALRETIRAAARAATARDLHAAVCRILVGRGVCALAFVASLDGGALLPVAAAGRGAEALLERGEPLAVLAGSGATRASADLDDVAVEPDLRHRGEASAWLARLEAAGLRSAASVDLRLDGRDIGRLVIAAERTDVFRSEHVELLRAVAETIGLRLEGLAERGRRQASEAALAAGDERFRRIVETTQDAVWLIDGSGRTGFASPRLGSLLARDPGSLTGRSALELIDPDDRPAFATLLAEPPAGPGRALELRLLHADGTVRWCRLAAAALDRQGATGGLLALVADLTEHRARDQELERVEFLRRQLLDRVVRAQERERTRIAQEVHDDSVQVLAGVGMLAETLGERLRDPDAQAGLGELSAAVREAIARLRALLLELHPAALDRHGLGEALRLLASERERLGGPGAQVVDESHVRPSPTSATVLYRIAQDALAHAIKHARAGSIAIALRTAGDGTVLSVSDDGIGVDPAVLQRRSAGLGFAAMQERAELAGGHLAVTSAPGQGTIVEAWVPNDAPTGDAGALGGSFADDPTSAAEAALVALGVELPPELGLLFDEGAR